MSGKTCPSCYKLTFYLTRTGRKCSQCGHEEEDPARAYRGDGVAGSRFSVDSLKAMSAPPAPARNVMVQSEWTP